MALWVAAGAAVVGAGYGIYAGEQQAMNQRRAEKRQIAQQGLAETAAMRQRKDAARAAAAAARKQPDLSAIIAGEEQLAQLSRGPATISGAKPPSPTQAPSNLGGY